MRGEHNLALASALPQPAPAREVPPAPHLRPLPSSPPADDPGRRNRSFFDRYWRHGTHERDQLWRAWWHDGYAQVLTWAGPLRGQRVLNVFAGLGEDAHMLAQHGADVVALDFAAEGLRQAARVEGSRPAWLCADATRLPLAAQSFDLVVAVNGLCHTDKPAVLAEFRRVLRPGGRILLLEVMRYPHLAMVGRWFEPYRKHAPHRHVSVGEIEELAQPFAGLQQRQFFVLSVLTAMLLRLPLGPRLVQPLHRAAIRADRRLMRWLPWLRHIAYLSAVELQA